MKVYDFCVDCRVVILVTHGPPNRCNECALRHEARTKQELALAEGHRRVMDAAQELAILERSNGPWYVGEYTWKMNEGNPRSVATSVTAAGRVKGVGGASFLKDRASIIEIADRMEGLVAIARRPPGRV